MNKLKDNILILGEGPTEFFYFNSLKDELHSVNIYPDTPKHSSLDELSKKIEQNLPNYSKIFCVNDMDNKDKEKNKYDDIVHKYQHSFVNPREGINCTVRFFETHLCTELFFLYYFHYTGRSFTDQAELSNELSHCCEYSKEKIFLRKGLHQHFMKNKGSLRNAVANANRSWKEAKLDYPGRDYTYSQLGELISIILPQYRQDKSADAEQTDPFAIPKEMVDNVKSVSVDELIQLAWDLVGKKDVESANQCYLLLKEKTSSDEAMNGQLEALRQAIESKKDN